MVNLLDGNYRRATPPPHRHHVAHILDVAEYLLLTEDSLMHWIPQYFLEDPLGARYDPQFIVSIYGFYIAGYCSLAKTLYILLGEKI